MDGGQLDSADHAILKLLQKAVGAAEANSQGALQRAAHELGAAKTASPNWSARSSTTVRSLNALKIGYAKFPWRLRIASSTSRKKRDGKCRGEYKQDVELWTNERKRRNLTGVVQRPFITAQSQLIFRRYKTRLWLGTNSDLSRLRELL